MPMTPRSNSLSMSARGIFACSSISRTSGRISRSANSKTLSRNSRSSSDSARERRAMPVRCFASPRRRDVIIGPWRGLFARSAVQPSRSVALVGIAAPRSAGDCHRRPIQTGPAAAAPPPTRRHRPVFRTGINFVRVDVIVTDKSGQRGRRSQSRRLRGHRGRQAADDRDLQARQARRRHAARRPTVRRAQIRTDSDEETRSGARRRAAVRDLPGRLSRAPAAPASSVREPLTQFIETQLGPVRHGRR